MISILPVYVIRLWKLLIPKQIIEFNSWQEHQIDTFCRLIFWSNDLAKEICFFSSSREKEISYKYRKTRKIRVKIKKREDFCFTMKDMTPPNSYLYSLLIYSNWHIIFYSSCSLGSNPWIRTWYDIIIIGFGSTKTNTNNKRVVASWKVSVEIGSSSNRRKPAKTRN